MYINSLSQGPQVASQIQAFNAQGGMPAQATGLPKESLGAMVPPGLGAGGSQQNVVSVVLQFALEVINNLMGLISQLMGGAGAGVPRSSVQEGGTGAKEGGFSFDNLLGKAGDFLGGLFGSGKEAKGPAGESKSSGGGIVDGILGLFGGGGSGGGAGLLGKVGSFIGGFF